MLKNKSVKLGAILLSVCLAVGLAACGKKDNSTQVAGANVKVQGTKLDEIKKAGKIIIGTSADYPPYEFHKSINGKDEIVGFDIEVAKNIAKDLGVKLEIKDMKFDGLLAALDSGKVDMVVAGMTPTPEREKNVDFTKIYYTAKQTVVVRAEDKDKIKTADDLKGFKLGVQKGSIQEDIAKKQIPGAQAVALPKISDLILSVQDKKFAASIIEGPVAEAYTNANKDIVISDINLKQEDAGSAVAVKKGNKDLVDAINKTLDKLLSAKSVDQFVIDANKLVEN